MKFDLVWSCLFLIHPQISCLHCVWGVVVFCSGVKLGLSRKMLSVWMLIPWNLLQTYSWDHKCRSPYCEKETDSSWKANEHVSAIWKSNPKHYASSVLRQRSHFVFMERCFLVFYCSWKRNLGFSQIQHKCKQCNKFAQGLLQITSHI